MNTLPSFTLHHSVQVAKAMGDDTRLRILALLMKGEMSIKDLCDILHQSQPRISRHVKILAEAELILRNKEGAWLYCAINKKGAFFPIIEHFMAGMNANQDKIMTDDQTLYEELMKQKAEQASLYFQEQAKSWDRIRAMQIGDDQLKARLIEIVTRKKITSLLDIGTGTGQILLDLEGLYDKAVGIDLSAQMLEIARARFSSPHHSQLILRQDNIMNLSRELSSSLLDAPHNHFDLVIAHHVLHFIPHPEKAIEKMAAQIEEGGRVIIVDYLPHHLHFLLEDYHHIWQGFSIDFMHDAMKKAGLKMDDPILLRSANARHQFSEIDLIIGIFVGHK